MVIHWFFTFQIVCVVFTLSNGQDISQEDLEDHICPEDLKIFLDMYSSNENEFEIGNRFGEDDDTSNKTVPEVVDCFGLGSFMTRLPSVFSFVPDTSDEINTHFYFSSREKPDRIAVRMGSPNSPLNYSSVDFKASRKTVVIIHGFMSHSNSSWVLNLTKAFIQWEDVNVIAVDWSKGGNTWKYWRAVANTRQVGSDVSNFLQQLQAESGANFKEFHLVGHSLGAHISSFVSHRLGGVARITGLDPAQPCFQTDDVNERLDMTDADFVDIIHTNARLLNKIGFGLPEKMGHADFYPNGGMRQPGCQNETTSSWHKLIPFYSKLQQAICSHGRSYLFFMESLVNNKCTFKAQPWDLTADGLNRTVMTSCSRGKYCAEMGIRAVGGDGFSRATGSYFTVTTDKQPYCPSEQEVSGLLSDLLHELRMGFKKWSYYGSSHRNKASTSFLSQCSLTKWVLNGFLVFQIVSIMLRGLC